jgi:hypothetical protein
MKLACDMKGAKGDLVKSKEKTVSILVVPCIMEIVHRGASLWENQSKEAAANKVVLRHVRTLLVLSSRVVRNEIFLPLDSP